MQVMSPNKGRFNHFKLLRPGVVLYCRGPSGPTVPPIPDGSTQLALSPGSYLRLSSDVSVVTGALTRRPPTARVALPGGVPLFETFCVMVGLSGLDHSLTREDKEAMSNALNASLQCFITLGQAHSFIGGILRERGFRVEATYSVGDDIIRVYRRS